MKKYLDKKRFGSLVGKGNLTEVMRLLADGVNVNYKGKVLFLFDPIIALVLCLFPQEDGETPLHSACFNGHSKIVRMLLDRVDIEYMSTDNV